LTAFKSPDPKVRNQAAAILENERPPITDPQLFRTAVALLNDSEPKVRQAAVYSLLDNWDPKYVEALVVASRDADEDVARAADYGLGRHKEDVQKYIPALETQLQDKDLRVRASAVKLLMYLGEMDQVSREVLLSLMSLPDQEVIGALIGQFRSKGPDRRINLSDDEVAPFLQNTEPLARLMGLNVLYQNAGSQSVQMTLPLLKDAEPGIRGRAAAVLRAMTGQHFTEDQADQWQAWWTANQAHFTVELHPEELHPRRFRPALNGTNEPPPSRLAPTQNDR
jgi:HEAT repeat protein